MSLSEEAKLSITYKLAAWLVAASSIVFPSWSIATTWMLVGFWPAVAVTSVMIGIVGLTSYLLWSLAANAGYNEGGLL